MSHLHARRKMQGHEEDHILTIPLAPLSEGVDKKQRSNPQNCCSGGNHSYSAGSGARSPYRELYWAVGAVICFVTIGLACGFFLLHQQHRRVIGHLIRDPIGHGRAMMLRGRSGFHHHFYTGAPRFVTVVMPSVVNPTGRTHRLKSIQDTWGPYARSIYVVHSVLEFVEASHLILSEESRPSDPYSYPQLLLLPRNISADDGLYRLMYTMKTIYQKVNPDFAFFVNDHTFVIPEHLCKYLEHRHPDIDLYAGHALKNQKEGIFNSGAAGYLLSRSTLRNMVTKWEEHDPSCWIGPEHLTTWLQGNPGLMSVQCLQHMGVYPIDTRANRKWHRFHAFPLTRVVSGKVDEWYLNKHLQMGIVRNQTNALIPGDTNFDASYAKLLSGQDCCSMDTISFHYVEHLESRALFATRETLLENPHLSDAELTQHMRRIWPNTAEALGGYSRALPKEDDVSAWIDLMAVMRKISTRRTQRDC